MFVGSPPAGMPACVAGSPLVDAPDAESGEDTVYRDPHSWKGDKSRKIPREFREFREFTCTWASGDGNLCASEHRTHGGRRMSAAMLAGAAVPGARVDGGAHPGLKRQG
jgi:hypothetical protein